MWTAWGQSCVEKSETYTKADFPPSVESCYWPVYVSFPSSCQEAKTHLYEAVTIHWRFQIDGEVRKPDDILVEMPFLGVPSALLMPFND